MTTKIFVTVGLSVFDSLELGKGVPTDLVDVDWSTWIGQLTKWSGERTGIPFGTLKKHLDDDAWALSDSHCISAERDSLHAYFASSLSGGEGLDSATIVLLATDTPEGMAAAFVNAFLLGGPVQLKGGTVDDFKNVEHSQGLRVGALCIEIYRVPELTPNGEVSRGLTSLAESIAAFGAQEGLGKAWVCLSGGMKMYIPPLLTACEYLKALGYISGAFIKHEAQNDVNNVRLRPVTIPKDLLARLSARNSGDYELEGFAFEHGSDTEVGAMLRRLLQKGPKHWNPLP